MPSPFIDSPPSYEELLRHFKEGRPTVGVIGLGYVGLPLCNAFHKSGFEVVGFDIDPVKIDQLGKGDSYLEYTDPSLFERLASSELFSATIDFSRLAEVDVIFICVPTPLGRHREPDLSYVTATGETIGTYLRPGQLVVLESTTYPGTTRESLLPALMGERGTLSAGQDFFVAYSPEREDPGRSQHTTENTPKLVGGLDSYSTELAAAVYSRCIKEIHVVATAEIAEASKILENTFRAVNIALVNELKQLMQRMGIDVFDVVRAAATKPFGFMPFSPGPGLGGHCIPIDPFYLTWKAREFGMSTKFVELAGEVNSLMPEYVVGRVAGALNERGIALRGARVLILGLAYKKNVDDVRESPSFTVAQLLLDAGAEVLFSDPHVLNAERERGESLPIARVDLTPAELKAMDAAVLLTDHDAFPYDEIAANSQLIIDTRGVYAVGPCSGGAMVVRA